MNENHARREAALIEQAKNERIRNLIPPEAPVRAEGERPQFIVIAGQQGAGKTTTQERLVAALGDRSVAAYDGDDNAKIHPRYADIMRANGISGVDAVGREMPKGHHQEYLANLRGDTGLPKYDVIASHPFGRKDWADAWIDGFRDRGYETTAVFVATHESDSMLGIAQRYQRDRDNPGLGYGRWVDPKLHYETYENNPAVAHYLEAAGKVDNIYIVDRNGEVLHENHRNADGSLERTPAAAQAMRTERNRKPTPDQTKRFNDQVAYLRSTDRSVRQEPVDPRVLSAVDYAEADRTALLRSGTDARATPSGQRRTVDQAFRERRQAAAQNRPGEPGPPAHRQQPAQGSASTGNGRIPSPGSSPDRGGSSGSSGPSGGGIPRPRDDGPKGPSPRPRSKRRPGAGLKGRIAGAASAAGVLLAGVGSATGMIPELSAVVNDPTAAAQQMIGQAPDATMSLLGNAAGPSNRPGAAAKSSVFKPAVGAKAGSGEASKLAADSKVATAAVKAQTDAVKAQADAVKKSSDAMKSHVSGVQKFGAAQKAVTAGSKAWAVAQTLLNVVMSANPIGAIVIGITAAVAAIVLLVKNWDKVKLAFDWVYKNVLLPVGNWFKDIWTESVVPAFRAATDMISGLFTGLGDSIKGVWDGVMSGIKWVVGKIADGLGLISNVGVGPFRTPDLSGIIDKLRGFSGGEKRADGGVIRGPGGPRGDAIAAWLSDGEYVINAESTARFKPLLDMINFGTPRTAEDEAQQAMRGLLGQEKVVTGDKAGTASIWSRAQDNFGSAASQFASGYTTDTLGAFGTQDTAPGFVQGLSQGSTLLQAQNDNSVIDAAVTDADSLSSLSDSPLTTQITHTCTGTPKVKRSTTINVRRPDPNTEFQKAKTWESQRALTYTARW
ncbi:zeta toxin family protein [Nocardia sp. NBC_01499]|uniref:zeta toxin family protein n=1 Tax=Nocardia sp. NBC_01499 TaxID=2903597 RepID=UPI00386C84DF